MGRVGGDEFAVFLPNADVRYVHRIAERIRLNVPEAPFNPGGTGSPLSVSIGGVEFGRPQPYPELFKAADAQLYAAKRQGRNRVEFDTALAA